MSRPEALAFGFEILRARNRESAAMGEMMSLAIAAAISKEGDAEQKKVHAKLRE